LASSPRRKPRKRGAPPARAKVDPSPGLTKARLLAALKTPPYRRAFHEIKPQADGSTEVTLEWNLNQLGGRDDSKRARKIFQFDRDGRLVASEGGWSPKHGGVFDRTDTIPFGPYRDYEFTQRTKYTPDRQEVLRWHHFGDGVYQQVSDSRDPSAPTRFTMGAGTFAIVLARALRYVADSGRPTVIDWNQGAIPVKPEDLASGNEEARKEIWRRMWRQEGRTPWW
jgi:hypothetical protein